MATIVTPLPVREAKVAGKLASRGLTELAIVAGTYPASYDAKRVMAEADVILDSALDEAQRICSRFPELEVVVWDDPLGALVDGEFAPKIR